MYTIEYTEGIIDDLTDMRTYDRARILDRIEEQLTYEPTQQTRNKKILIGLVPPWVPFATNQRTKQRRKSYEEGQFGTNNARYVC
ncbi:hypothetical protein ACFLXQ_00555 [Chloroflexota bacterium]